MLIVLTVAMKPTVLNKTVLMVNGLVKMEGVSLLNGDVMEKTTAGMDLTRETATMENQLFAKVSLSLM